ISKLPTIPERCHARQDGEPPETNRRRTQVDKLNLPVLLGTSRKQRKSVYAAKWLVGEMEKRPDIETRLFDVSEFALPQDDYGTEIKDQFPEWRDAVMQADGLVIVSPEYNHGYPGVLKAVLDLLLKEYIHKAVAFVGVSAGTWGGTRVIEAMVPMVRELGLAVTFTDLNFAHIQKKFDEQGKLLDPAYEQRAKDFLDELVWMSRALKWGREHVPSKHHPDPVS
ncbi:MAG: NAD(P)H-dependent oxidoreductase, partial [Pyrinomonadaceae bacterium]|nr:NAD(P)H-dependent oxidoreductase [Pyrinomonadaceae bacterium]